MKDYILNLLSKCLEENKVYEKSANYDIAFLKEIIEKVENNKEYFYEFILDLNSDLIKDIISLVEPESARESFLASIIYLKNLLEIDKKEDVKIPLSQNQIEILYQLFELIKQIVLKDDEVTSEVIKYVQKNAKKYQRLYNKLEKNKELDVDDYDLIENLVKEKETGNVNKVLNDVFDYLNTYNYKLLPEFVPKKVIEEPVIEPQAEISDAKEEPIEKAILPQEENKIADVVQDNEDNQEEKQVDDVAQEELVQFEEVEEPKLETINVKKSIDFDIFNPQSFVYDGEENKVGKKRRKKSILQKTESIEKDLNDGCLSKLLANDKLKKYTAELADEDSLTILLNYFEEKNISTSVIDDLINRCTQIFFAKYKNSFIDNANLALNYGANLEKLIKNNITYFYNSFDYNKNKINLLEQKGININLLFEIKPQLLAIGIDKLLKNLDLLKSYGLIIQDRDYESLSIIAASNLNIILDTFIETGFSTYLTDGLKNIRSLIIKRIFYAYKNELSVWNENISEDRINSKYEEWINKERTYLSDEEINNLVNNYSILESLEETKRPVVFTDPINDKIRKKYEFKFGNIIISRLKTFSIFKVLIEHNVDVNEALVYALTYNSNLDNSDYMLIKNEIFGK